MEGGDPVSVCLVVMSVIGQLIETVFVGFSGSMITGVFNFDGAQVGDEILCQTFNFSDDNVVEQRPDALLSAFIEASPLITFVPERDVAILRFVDNDRMFLTITSGTSQIIYLTPHKIKEHTSSFRMLCKY